MKKPGYYEHIMGWREWVTLPDINVPWIKAKIDTGARTSCIHAYDLYPFEKNGLPYIRFKVHPIQDNSHILITAEAPIHEYRKVKSSSGHESYRPVIMTKIIWNGLSWPIELNLANRDQMGFRMLLGRAAIRGRVLVDAKKSFYSGQPLKSEINQLYKEHKKL